MYDLFHILCAISITEYHDDPPGVALDDGADELHVGSDVVLPDCARGKRKGCTEAGPGHRPQSSLAIAPVALCNWNQDGHRAS